MYMCALMINSTNTYKSYSRISQLLYIHYKKCMQSHTQTVYGGQRVLALFLLLQIMMQQMLLDVYCLFDQWEILISYNCIIKTKQKLFDLSN